MDITATLVKLKQYFKQWHNDNFNELHPGFNEDMRNSILNLANLISKKINGTNGTQITKLDNLNDILEENTLDTPNLKDIENRINKFEGIDIGLQDDKDLNHYKSQGIYNISNIVASQMSEHPEYKDGEDNSNIPVSMLIVLNKGLRKIQQIVTNSNGTWVRNKDTTWSDWKKFSTLQLEDLEWDRIWGTPLDATSENSSHVINMYVNYNLREVQIEVYANINSYQTWTNNNGVYHRQINANSSIPEGFRPHKSIIIMAHSGLQHYLGCDTDGNIHAYSRQSIDSKFNLNGIFKYKY